MKKNMGMTDKLIRVVIGVIIAVMYYFNFFSGTLGTVLAIVAILLLLTSLLNFCPIYRLFGYNTCKVKE